MTRGRLLVVVTSAVLIALVAACASSGSPSSSEPGSSTFRTTIPPSSEPGSSTEITTTPTIAGGAVDCGTFDLASGWPTTMAPPQDLYRCLDDAFRSGQPARLVLSAQTDGEGGAPVTTTYLVTGQGVVRVTIDATRAADRPQAVTKQECRALTATWPEVTVSNCENMDH